MKKTFSVLLLIIGTSFSYAINMKEGKTVKNIESLLIEKTKDKEIKLKLQNIFSLQYLDLLTDFFKKEDPNYYKYFAAHNQPILKNGVINVNLFWFPTVHSHQKKFGFVEYTIEINDSLIGLLDLNENGHTDIPELSIYIKKSLSKNGLATKIIAAVIKMVKENIDTKEIYWFCDQKNFASSKIAKKNGFVLQNDFNKKNHKKKLDPTELCYELLL